MYITLESLDGGGKGTVVERLKKIFSMTNRPFITTREPGGTAVGESIREMLLTQELSTHMRINLFSASRKLNTEMVVKPALDARRLVIGERSNSSTIVFQGYVSYLLGMEDISIFDYIKDSFNHHRIDIVPDLSILIEVEEQERQRRLNQRGEKDIFEDVDDKFINSLRTGYHEVYVNKVHPWAAKEFAVVESTTPHDTTAQILRTLGHHLILSVNDVAQCLKANDLIDQLEN